MVMVDEVGYALDPNEEVKLRLWNQWKQRPGYVL